jgi:glycerophosphoryl diester phosphodiesterase
MWDQSEKNILVAGHRGLPELYPENTLLSFKKAIEAGVDMIELDVQKTKDGRLVIMHDLNLDRTTNSTGPLKDKTFAEIKALDASYKFGEQFGVQRVPELVEFMELVKDYPDLSLDFELKEYPIAGNEKRAFETADETIEMIEKYGCGDKCVLNAFSATLLEYIETEYHHKYRLHGYYPKELMKRGIYARPVRFHLLRMRDGARKGQIRSSEIKEASTPGPARASGTRPASTRR